MTDAEATVLGAIPVRGVGYGSLYTLLRQYIPADPAYYLRPDEVTFSMLSKDEPHIGYFVDDKSHATPIHQHPDFTGMLNDPPVVWRLYTVREAVPDILRELRSRRH